MRGAGADGFEEERRVGCGVETMEETACGNVMIEKTSNERDVNTVAGYLKSMREIHCIEEKVGE